MRTRGKRDANERQIIDALEAIGVWTTQLDGGDGKPDLACAEPVNHSWWMVEVKEPGTGRLTAKQKVFHRDCPGRIHLVETALQAVEVAATYMRKHKE